MPIRMVFRNKPGVYDFNFFATRQVPAAPQTSVLPQVENIHLPKPHLWVYNKQVDSSLSAEEFLASHGTNALLIMRNDTIVYEKYFNGFRPQDRQLGFSLTKAVISTLTAIANQEGLICPSQPVCELLPEFKGNGKEQVTIDHLLNMTSGLNHADYTRKIRVGYLYYGLDHYRTSMKAKLIHAPGTQFEYKSVDTQLLGLCLTKATGKPMTQYLYEKLWEPMGMEFPAEWCLDKKDGVEKMFGGLVLSPRDVLRLGKLYLNRGNWNGQQLVAQEWATLPSLRDTLAKGYQYYRNAFWRYTCKYGFDENQELDQDFYASGLNGQVMYVNPATNTVIVRMGAKRKGVWWTYAMSALSRFPTQPLEAKVPRELQNSLSGTYQAPGKKPITVQFKDGKLQLARLKRKIIEYRTENPFQYISFDADNRLAFQVKSDKEVNLNLEISSETVRFFKISD
jgi:CubicO group peptidase (beta-lactamase class C family)